MNKKERKRYDKNLEELPDFARNHLELMRKHIEIVEKARSKK